MAQIGDTVCTFVKGHAGGLKLQVELWRGTGHAGHGALISSRVSDPFQFRAVRYNSPADIEAWHNNLESYQGTVITIIDDRGISHPNCLITRVGPLRHTAAAGFDLPQFSGTRGEVLIEGVVIA